MQNFKIQNKQPRLNYTTVFICIFTLLVLFFLSNCADVPQPTRVYGDHCTLCHGDAPPATPLHLKLAVDSNYVYNCNVCHQGYTRANWSLNQELHNNGIVDIQPDSQFFDSVFTDSQYTKPLLPMAYTVDESSGQAIKTCSNIPCHGAGYPGKLNVQWATSANVGDTLGCMGCHNTAAHWGGNNYCQRCHGRRSATGVVTLTAIGDSVIYHDSLHINGKVDLYP